IDADGILHVSAKDLGSGKEQKIKMEAKSGLDDAEIERMVKDAEIHAEEDKLKKEEVESRNQADALVFQAVKSLNEHKDKLSAELTSEITSKVDHLKKTLEGQDTDAIKAATSELSTHLQKLGAAMQQQAGAQAEGAPTSDAPKAEKPDIEEAEVEILDKEDK
ncbi:MAG: Hsp70 family protein, partial [Simkaniaceae bacterium]|nr:Hsp70 family protein [Simkaniaceae bacterium]